MTVHSVLVSLSLFLTAKMAKIKNWRQLPNPLAWKMNDTHELSTGRATDVTATSDDYKDKFSWYKVTLRIVSPGFAGGGGWGGVTSDKWTVCGDWWWGVINQIRRAALIPNDREGQCQESNVTSNARSQRVFSATLMSGKGHPLVPRSWVQWRITWLRRHTMEIYMRC